MAIENDLVRYAREAVRRDVETKVSVHAKAAAADFVALGGPPWPVGAALAGLPGLMPLKAKAKAANGTMRIGFPVVVRQHKAWSFLEPLLLFPFPGPGGVLGDIRVNRLAVETLAGPGGADGLEEEIRAKLGLDDPQGDDLPAVPATLLDALRAYFPTWPWQVPPRPLGPTSVPGIWGSSAVFLDRSPDYTAGLVAELQDMAKLPEAAFQGSALSAWARRTLPPAGPDLDVLEVVPLNAEQREAVCAGLSQPLTVISGPPGTGKSQVVTALVANAVWHGQSVLLASSNNKAVDVGESRVAALSDDPVIVRIGTGKRYLASVVEMVGKALAGFATPNLNAAWSDAKRSSEQACATLQVLHARYLTLAASRDAAVAATEREAAMRALLESRRLVGKTRLARLLQHLTGILRSAVLYAALGWRWVQRRGREARLLTLADGTALLDQMEAAVHRCHEADLTVWKLAMQKRIAALSPADRAALANVGVKLKFATDGGNGEPGWAAILETLKPVVSAWAVTSLSAKGKVPLESGLFDLLIMDEASQCDISSVLPLLFRAKRVVVLGDKMQLPFITQLSVGADAALLAQHGLDQTHQSWAHSAASLYDLALAQGARMVTLREHHRSHPAIIGYSNTQFYTGALRVGTPIGKLLPPKALKQLVTWVHQGGSIVEDPQGGVLQEAVAQRTVEGLRRLLLDQAYTGTVGVVTPFRAQMRRIRDLVADDAQLSAAGLGANLLIDAAHGFQGDERDTMVFSLVAGPDLPAGAHWFLRTSGNLFNVAVTRARGALIVVGDRDGAADLGIPHLSAFVDHVGKIEAQADTAAEPVDHGPEFPSLPQGGPAVSEEEKSLYRALHRLGLQPQPQFRVEQYSIDLALLGEWRKLAVEVDGLQHKWDADIRWRDAQRQKRLTELGWTVKRLWAFEVRRNPSACAARVRGWFDQAQGGR